MRLRLDRDLCVGHAQCFAIDPDLFPIDDDGFSLVEDQEVPEDQVAAAQAGVNACPERALRLEGDA
ncbi:putative 3Fe-4S ferredoxin [Gordonia namibiensis NBRC 108229]|uniref:Putative 3Fe-4S ferredoxin n=1 Tax=Gordonia namibiensis NBRC 108229 TaxID=1208314 RepID=K6X2D5_9ACTN|nr:ferredoxin [Gordonia namibiensis]GAB98542.1 putative 3Fe-4S ferredoxin [Gordonia namibiensis NBRC 108229]